MSLDANDLVRLFKSVGPTLILLVFVVGLALRLAIKPTIDAIIKLREASRADYQTQQRIARLEDEVSRLRGGDLPSLPGLDDGSRWKDPIVRRESP